jgi:hypothetical protein
MASQSIFACDWMELSPDQNHGVDVDIHGDGVVRDQRLYQLIRQSKDVVEHTFSIEFLDQAAQAYSFTFG